MGSYRRYVKPLSPRIDTIKWNIKSVNAATHTTTTLFFVCRCLRRPGHYVRINGIDIYSWSLASWHSRYQFAIRWVAVPPLSSISPNWEGMSLSMTGIRSLSSQEEKYPTKWVNHQPCSNTVQCVYGCVLCQTIHSQLNDNNIPPLVE